MVHIALEQQTKGIKSLRYALYCTYHLLSCFNMYANVTLTQCLPSCQLRMCDELVPNTLHINNKHYISTDKKKHLKQQYW